MSANADNVAMLQCGVAMCKVPKCLLTQIARGASKDSPEVCKVPKCLLAQIKYLVTKNSYLIFLLEKNSL